MRKLTIILVLLLFLQGCVSTKTGQLSIPLPKNISKPSALVIKDKYIGVLSMDGKFDPLYKVNGGLEFQPQNEMGANNQKSLYFAIKSRSFLSPNYSLWDLDFSSKKLSCLVPSLKNISEHHGFYVTPDKDFLLYSSVYFEKEIHFPRPIGLYYEGLFLNEKIYSLKHQKEIRIPEIKGLVLYDFQLGLFPGWCFLIYLNKNYLKDQSWYLYLWNMKNNDLNRIQLPGLKNLKIRWIDIEETEDSNQIILNVEQIYKKNDTSSDFSSLFVLDIKKLKAKFLFSTTSGYVAYYKEFGWFIFDEDNNLIRYDVKVEKKETLNCFTDYPSCNVFENKSILVKIDKNLDIFEILKGNWSSYNSYPDFYLMKPEGQWIKINDLNKNEIIQDVSPISYDAFLLSINNLATGFHQIIQWNPITNTKETILEEKNCTYIGIGRHISPEFFLNQIYQTFSENYRSFSKKNIGLYLQFKVKMNDKKNKNYVYNYFTKELKAVPALNSPDIYAQATGKLIWIIMNSTHDAKRLYLLDWNNPANDKPKIDFNEKTHQKKSYYFEKISPDKTYIPITGYSKDDHTDKQLWFVNTQTGKELTFPYSKDFEFITWLEDK